MTPNLFRSRLTWVPALTLLGLLGLATQGLAQQQSSPAGTTSDADKTGVGQRGTKVAPSSNPTLATNPASPPPSTTGATSRGSKAGPTTTPGSPTQTPSQTR
jgi:hypothetical protein